MLFKADIRTNFTLEEINLEKTEIRERNFHQQVRDMKPKFTLILD